MLSSVGTVLHGLKDAESHMLNEWLGFSKIPSLHAEATAALDEFKFCPQASDFFPSGEDGGNSVIQCGNSNWLSPVEDLERRAHEQGHPYVAEPVRTSKKSS